MDNKKEKSLDQLLSELEEIMKWFDNQENIDLGEGLQKVKQGNDLIKESKKRLQNVENEFKEISK